VFAALAAGLFATAAIGELGLRGARALSVGRFADARTFAHPYCDENYHELRLLDREEGGVSPLAVNGFVQHRILGWKPGPALARELGLVRDGVPQRADVALFGDSFAAGVPPVGPDETITAYLDELLPDQSVLNYAVPGYGVDQIFLRYLEIVGDDRTRPDTAVVAILVDDIDRVLQPIRAAPKPLFALDGGSLVLRNVTSQAASAATSSHSFERAAPSGGTGVAPSTPRAGGRRRRP